MTLSDVFDTSQFLTINLDFLPLLLCTSLLLIQLLAVWTPSILEPIQDDSAATFASLSSSLYPYLHSLTSRAASLKLPCLCDVSHARW